ncbi:hypothetical protein [Butyrivibrio sp. AE3004]|uniref:hypothetical protein n=1 Tax=Butyrivibrio sp. AE3004 TaxID=1506994 RepID=UPI000494441E|nr:hypothetical protein [Butyrivibrio sp. AE3004]
MQLKKQGLFVKAMVIVLTLVMSFMYVPSMKTYAKNMKSSGFRFNLSAEKDVTVYRQVAGLKNLRPFTFRVKSIKRKEANDRITVTLNVVMKDGKGYSKKDVDRIVKKINGRYSYGTVWSSSTEKWGILFVDYKTGKFTTLAENDVQISATGWQIYRSKVYSGKYGRKYRKYTRYYNTIEVSFPSDYKDLCFGVYGSPDYRASSADFDAGLCSFAASALSNKSTRKKTSSWMRIQ